MVDNGKGGFDLHHLDSGVYIRTLFTRKPTRRVPKQAVFAEVSKGVVCGSDHGSIYVFGRKGSEPLQILQHAADALVQTVTVYEDEQLHLIAAATSEKSGEIKITLWHARSDGYMSLVRKRATNTGARNFERNLMRALMVIWGLVWLGY